MGNRDGGKVRRGENTSKGEGERREARQRRKIVATESGSVIEPWRLPINNLVLKHSIKNSDAFEPMRYCGLAFMRPSSPDLELPSMADMSTTAGTVIICSSNKDDHLYPWSLR